MIDQNPALQERELHKFATLATALADALRARGVDEPAATLAAQSAVTVFGIAFTQWTSEGEQRSFADLAAGVLRELSTLTSGHDGFPQRPPDGPETAHAPEPGPQSPVRSPSQAPRVLG